MANKKVRVNSIYHYVPVMIDRCNPPIAAEMGVLTVGDRVRVINLQGCPKANTMGHCHFASMDGKFGGLCCTNSLLTVDEYRAYLQMRIRDMEHDAAVRDGSFSDADSGL